MKKNHKKSITIVAIFILWFLVLFLNDYCKYNLVFEKPKYIDTIDAKLASPNNRIFPATAVSSKQIHDYAASVRNLESASIEKSCKAMEKECKNARLAAEESAKSCKQSGEDTKESNLELKKEIKDLSKIVLKQTSEINSQNKTIKDLTDKLTKNFPMLIFIQTVSTLFFALRIYRKNDIDGITDLGFECLSSVAVGLLNMFT